MPFTIRPAREKSFINREDEIRDILSTLRNPQMKMGFALYGPRRMGKTSLLLKVADELKGDPKTAVTYFSVWDLVEQDLESFVREFTSAILDSFRTYLPLKFRANVSQYLIYLTEKGILEVEEKGIYGFVDPVFKMWLKNKYSMIVEST